MGNYIRTGEIRGNKVAGMIWSGIKNGDALYEQISFIKTHYLLFMVLSVYLTLSLFFLDRRFVIDEPWSVIPVFQVFENGGFWVTAIHNGAHPTILHQFTNYQILLFIWHLVVPDELVFSRLLTVVFTLGTLTAVYLLAYRILKNYRWSALAAAILAMDNVFFITSYSIRPDAFLAIGMPLMLLIMYGDDFILREKGLFLAGLTGGILTGFHTNFILAVTAIAIIYLIWEFRRHRLMVNIRNILIYSAGVFIGIFPVLMNIFIFDMPEKAQLNNYVGSYLEKTTTIDENRTILNIDEMLKRESHRYNDFIQFPFRLHISLLFAAGLIFGLFSKRKIIRIIAVFVIITLLFYTALLANKTMRYFALVLPALSILVTYMFYSFIKDRNPGRGVKMTFYTVITLIPLSLLAGNIYTLNYFWDTSYSELKKQISFPHNKEVRILGDLLFWDIFRSSRYLSYHSDFDYLKSQKYDYIITGSSSRMKHRRRDHFREVVIPASRAQMVKEHFNFYYGDIKIYRMLK